MTHPTAPWQLTIAMATTRKGHTRTKKEGFISSWSKPHPCSHIGHEYSSHSFQSPPIYLNAPIYLVSLPELGRRVDWWNRFHLLHSLVIEWSLCCSSLSIDFVIVCGNQIVKESPLPRWGVSAWARTLSQVQLFNLVTQTFHLNP